MENARILVPIDFSELNEHALKAANIFANIFQGTVTPFHAYIPVTDLDGFYYVGSGINQHEKYSEIEKALHHRLQISAEKYIDKEILKPPVLDVGNPARSILYTSKDFDLVIMSTHGRTGFSRFIMGSVTEKVLRMCSKPMVTVSRDSHLGDLTSILLTTDFSENSLSVFPFAKLIAETTNGTIDLISIVSSEHFFDSPSAEATAEKRKKDIMKLADDYFGNIRERVHPMILNGQRAPHIEIKNIVNQNNYNLIMQASVGRSGLDYLMMGSTASQVVRSVSNAVFTVNPHGISTETARKLHYQDRNE